MVRAIKKSTRKARAAKARKATVGLAKARGGKRESDCTGTPPIYRPEFCEVAYQMCAGEDPATDIDLADEFGVTERSIVMWRRRYPDFALACKLGKAEADDRVERSLYHKAVGYTYDAEEIKVIDGKVVRIKVRKHEPPCTIAMMKWLHNRRPAVWREKHELTHIGADGGPMQYVVRMPEAVASIEEWMQKSK